MPVGPDRRPGAGQLGEQFRSVPPAWRAFTVRRLLQQMSGLPLEPRLAAAECQERDRFVAALVEGLVERHVPPGKTLILGTRTLGAVTTSVQVLFGSTPETLCLFRHGQKLNEVRLDETDYPPHVTSSRRGELYEAKSLDGKQARSP